MAAKHKAKNENDERYNVFLFFFSLKLLNILKKYISVCYRVN